MYGNAKKQFVTQSVMKNSRLQWKMNLFKTNKLAEHDNFTRAVSRRYCDRGQEIGKYCPLPEPIRLQDSQDTARSQSKK